MDVLARTHELTVDARSVAPRAPWQTRFSNLPAAPAAGDRRVSPIAIPVIGGRPIEGRHLVRAPWAEPLAAFAGVIVETQLVPDAWITPRSAARRAVDPPVAAIRPAATSASAAAPRPLVAIPIVPDRDPTVVRTAALAHPGAVQAPVRVVARPAPAPVLPPAIVMSALGRPHASVPATAAAPIEPVVPSPVPSAPAPARRGLLGRAVVLAAGLVMSLVAVEAAARLGRR